MSQIAEDRRKEPPGKSSEFLGLSSLALGFSLSLFAQAKTLYYEGYPWDWAALQGGGIQWTQYAWDGSNLNIAASDDMGPNSQVLGSLGLASSTARSTASASRRTMAGPSGT